MKKAILSLFTVSMVFMTSAQTYVITRTLGSYGTVGNDGNGGPAAAATCGGPWDVCTDTAGNVYVLCFLYPAVKRLPAFEER